jgi:predicted metal-dependent hydrolase
MTRHYCEGEIFPYRGKPVSFRLTPTEKGHRAASLSDDGREILVSAASVEERRKCVLFFYTARTEEIIRSTLPGWAKKLSVRPTSAGVKYAKTRWGSCTAAGKLFFNSRLSMLSPDVAEYIVVHELCHLKQMNHSPAFWDCVRAALPNCMALRRKLRVEERAAVL